LALQRVCGLSFGFGGEIKAVLREKYKLGVFMQARDSNSVTFK